MNFLEEISKLVGLSNLPNSINEGVPSLVGHSIAHIVSSFVGYCYGLKRSFEEMKNSKIIDSINITSVNMSVLDFYHCKNIFEVAKKADEIAMQNGISGDFEFSFEWFERFYDAASRAYDDNIQSIWAEILSGEAEERGRYSLRFIESLKLLSQEEAQTFLKVSKLILRSPSGGAFVFIPENHELLDLYSDFDVLDTELILLEECGLINMGVEATNELDLEKEFSGFFNDQFFVDFNIQEGSSITTFEFHSYSLTRFGVQLYDLIEEQSSAEFIISLAKLLKSKFYDEIAISVKPYKLIEDENGVGLLLGKRDILS